LQQYYLLRPHKHKVCFVFLSFFGYQSIHILIIFRMFT
jgi:hypothetical protein